MLQKLLQKKALWTGLTFVFAFLLCFSIILGLILEQFSATVDSYLGTQSTTLESDEEDDTLYSVYTPNDLYVNKDEDGNITSGNSTAMIQAAINQGESEGAEGTVLLKNTGILPLNSETVGSAPKVTLLGMRSHKPLLSAGMGITTSGPVITLEDALSSTKTDWSNGARWMSGSAGSEMDEFTFTGAGYSLNPTAVSYYDTQCSSAGYSYKDGITTTIQEPSSSDLTTALGSCSGYTDAVIVVLGRAGSEAYDYLPGDDGSDPLALTANEKSTIEFAKSVTSNNGHVILIINSCNNVEIDEYKNDDGIGAILNIGFPGNYGMLGVADVLCGTATPSGALADIAAADNNSAPAMQNMGDYSFSNADSITRGENSKYYVVEAENIYTGYRYYETRYEDSVLNATSTKATGSAGVYKSTGSSWDYAQEVTYGFGYGLSYTTFSQEILTDEDGDVQVVVNDDRENNSITIDIPVEVTNTGETYSGKSIVQIYGQAPYIEGGVEKTSIQLLGFEKTGIIEPGESETVTVTVDLQNIASYDSSANEGKGGYIMDKGTYYFAVGNGAHDALNNIILAKDSSKTADDLELDAKVDKSDVSSENISSLVYTYEFSPSEGEQDQTTFSTSKAGVAVENQIPYADINYYQENTATYLTRSDWSSFPQEYGSLAAPSSMMDDLNGTGGFYYQTTNGAKDSNGQDTSAYTWGSTDTSFQFYQMRQAPWDDEVILANAEAAKEAAEAEAEAAEAEDEAEEEAEEEAVATWDALLSQITMNEAMYFNAFGGPNIAPAASIGVQESYVVDNNGNGIVFTFAKNQETSACPWYISESKNSAWSASVFGSSTLLAQTFSPEVALHRGEFIGNESLFLGISLIWGPGLNTHRTAYNGRNCEYYSEDPVLCGIVAEYYSYGCAEYGLLDAPKHFAFNDQETNRTGIAPFMTEQRAREVELRAYQIAIESPDLDKIAAIAANPEQISPNYTGMFGVMTSYSKIGAVECTCSRGLLTGILRNEWGFHGYTVTDLTDDVELYTSAVYAGITGYDIRESSGYTTSIALCDTDTCKYFQARKQISGETLDSSAYANDAAMMEAIRTNNKNLLWALSQTNLMNRYSASTRSVSHIVWWEALYISFIVIFAVLTAAAVAMYVLTYVLKKKDDGDSGSENKIPEVK